MNRETKKKVNETIDRYGFEHEGDTIAWNSPLAITLGFLLVFGCGYFFNDLLEPRMDIEGVANYFETKINNSDYGFHMSDSLTIGEWKHKYYIYGQVARSMLRYESSKICNICQHVDDFVFNEYDLTEEEIELIKGMRDGQTCIIEEVT